MAPSIDLGLGITSTSVLQGGVADIQNNTSVSFIKFTAGDYLYRTGTLGGMGGPLDAWSISFWTRDLGGSTPASDLITADGAWNLGSFTHARSTAGNINISIARAKESAPEYGAVAILGRPNTSASSLDTDDGYVHFLIQAERLHSTADQRVRIYKNGTLVDNSDWTDSTISADGQFYDNWMVGGHALTGRIGLDPAIAPWANLLLGKFWLDDTVTGVSVSDFYTAGETTDLGSTGQNPTGSTPLLFFDGDASTFGTNLGTTGAFLTYGTITDA